MPGLCANPSHHPILQAAGSPRRWPEHASQRSASTLVRPSPVAVECGLGTPLPPRRLIARQATSRALGARLPPSRSNDTREGWRGSWHAPPGAPPSPAAAGGRIQPSAPPLTPFVTLLARERTRCTRCFAGYARGVTQRPPPSATPPPLHQHGGAGVPHGGMLGRPGGSASVHRL